MRGKLPNVLDQNKRHDGRYGNWLEKQFGIKPNGKNAADILGYELKNETSTGRTSFGDWSANEYVFTKKEYSSLFNGSKKYEK